jgi:hypothetical protein
MLGAGSAQGQALPEGSAAIAKVPPRLPGNAMKSRRGANKTTAL